MPNTTSGLHKFVLTHSARFDGIFFYLPIDFIPSFGQSSHFSASFFVQCNKICKTYFLTLYYVILINLERFFKNLEVMIKEGSKLEAIYDDILNIIALGRKKGKWTSIEQLIENIEEVPSKHPPNQEVLNITKVGISRYTLTW